MKHVLINAQKNTIPKISNVFNVILHVKNVTIMAVQSVHQNNLCLIKNAMQHAPIITMENKVNVRNVWIIVKNVQN